MSRSIVKELLFLAQFLALGAVITFLYDILRIFRRVVRHAAVCVAIEDLAFWTGCAVSTFYLLYRENNGSIRWFAVMGAMLGMLLYRATIGRFFVHYVSALFLKIKKMFAPLARPFQFGKKKLAALIRALKLALSHI